MVQVAIVGASGRMGQQLLTACRGSTDVNCVTALVRPGHPWVGQDAGLVSAGTSMGVAITADPESITDEVDVVIDFTLPDYSITILEYCLQKSLPLVIGTTGFSVEQAEIIRTAGTKIPIVWAPNMGVGVNLCLSLLQTAAQVLGEEVDIEIIETHHRHKVDAPSGTALKMGEVIASTLGYDLDTCAIHGRHGVTGERPPHGIGFSAIRAGDVVGEHTVLFASQGERIEITHKASSRLTFAQGALRAACWLQAQQPGLFDMQDVLGLKAPRSP